MQAKVELFAQDALETPPLMTLCSRSKQPRLNGLLLLATLFCLLSALPSQAAKTPVTVIIGGKTVPFIVSPYVGPQGQVFAPVDAVRLLGASYTPNSRDQTVTITGAMGKKITVPYILEQARYCVPLQKIALALGASTDWQPTTQTLTIRAKLEMVRQDANALTIYTTYPIYYSVRTIDGPQRIYVDLYGLDLAALPANVPSRSGEVEHIRSGQLNFQTVRITIDLKKDVTFKVVSAIQTNHVQVALGQGGHEAFEGGLPPMPVPPPVVVVNPPTPVLPANAPGIRITNIGYKVVSDSLTQIAITTTGPAKFRTETLSDPNRLAFDLAGATVDMNVHPIQTLGHAVIQAIRPGLFRAPDLSFGRIVVDLKQMVGFTVTSQAAGQGMVYLINLQTPHPHYEGRPDNSPIGKIIVVDPGHGGEDSGAVGINAREKDFNLAIGRKLRDVLAQNGATVYMTRENDSFPSLDARPRLAVTRQADYFISVHCDEAGGRNSHSGTTVYFHAQNPTCRRLADDISRRVAEVSGIPRAGIKSDTIRFVTGFAVLRKSPMPAVLVECGYMNNDQDVARLRDDATQEHIAQGIVAGLRDFIAEQSSRSTRR